MFKSLFGISPSKEFEDLKKRKITMAEQTRESMRQKLLNNQKNRNNRVVGCFVYQYDGARNQVYLHSTPFIDNDKDYYPNFYHRENFNPESVEKRTQ